MRRAVASISAGQPSALRKPGGGLVGCKATNGRCTARSGAKSGSGIERPGSQPPARQHRPMAPAGAGVGGARK